MPKTIINQLDEICRTLELQQKRHQQHPDFFRDHVFNIKTSIDLLELPGFYAYLVPFCFQLRLSLSIIKSSDGILSNEKIFSENIRMINRLGIPVLHSTTRQ